MHIVPSNMCTKFHLKLMKGFLCYEVRLKLCDMQAMHDDNAKGITIDRLFFFRNTDKLKMQYSQESIFSTVTIMRVIFYLSHNDLDPPTCLSTCIFVENLVRNAGLALA